MSEEPTPEEWEWAIATYQGAYRDLIRLGVVLPQSDQDLVQLKRPAHDLDVLLRYRLLPQPGGFERRAEGRDADSAPSRPSRD